MPPSGRYIGEIRISLQSKLNNSSMIIRFKDPEVKKIGAGWRITDDNNNACVSNIDIERVETFLITPSSESYEIYYNESQLKIGIGFYEAA